MSNEQSRFRREALHLSLCAAEDGISEQQEEDLRVQLDTLWTQLTEVEQTCAPDLRADGTGPEACAYLVRAPATKPENT